MKKRILLILTLFSVLWSNVFSQAKVIKDASGNIIAFECADGTIKNTEVRPLLVVHDTLDSSDTLINENIESVNSYSNVIVSMLDSVTVIDPAGNIIAVYNPGTKELRDSNNEVIFKLNEINQVLDDQDILQGWINESGQVFRNDGLMIGQSEEIDPFKLAYLFFYTNK